MKCERSIASVFDKTPVAERLAGFKCGGNPYRRIYLERTLYPGALVPSVSEFDDFPRAVLMDSLGRPHFN